MWPGGPPGEGGAGHGGGRVRLPAGDRGRGPGGGGDHGPRPGPGGGHPGPQAFGDPGAPGDERRGLHLRSGRRHPRRPRGDARAQGSAPSGAGLPPPPGHPVPGRRGAGGPGGGDGGVQRTLLLGHLPDAPGDQPPPDARGADLTRPVGPGLGPR